MSYCNLCTEWFKWADAFVLTYSVSDNDSFTNIKAFYDEIKRVQKTKGVHVSDIPIILVATKGTL